MNSKLWHSNASRSERFIEKYKVKKQMTNTSQQKTPINITSLASFVVDFHVNFQVSCITEARVALATFERAVVLIVNFHVSL
jgi:hypothetical protein